LGGIKVADLEKQIETVLDGMAMSSPTKLVPVIRRAFLRYEGATLSETLAYTIADDLMIALRLTLPSPYGRRDSRRAREDLTTAILTRVGMTINDAVAKERANNIASQVDEFGLS
jgi:hypothetical protein